MTKLGVEYVVAYSNLFIQFEQDMAKFVIFLDYYHNVYDGMGVGRLDECYQKREGMVKRNNS
jgi:hypothetical protein